MPFAKYTITGASGWLGREFISHLISSKTISSFEEVKLYSSKRRILEFPGFGSTTSESFLETNKSDFAETEHFIHLAFLTRDLLVKYGAKEFIEVNKRLTSRAIDFIATVKPRYVSNVSSGAVFSRETGNLETDIGNNPYGYGKLEEEKLLKEVCEKYSINLSIGRLWGATGLYMPVNRAYAISDLICMGILEKRLVIKAKNLVFRRYCDAGEFMNVLAYAAKKERFTLFDSGGPKVEIEDLASFISKEIGVLNIERQIDPTIPIDDYYPRSQDYEKLLNLMGLMPEGLETQVRKTVEGHRNQLSKVM
jgi:nucleoside-diphosphate-sugar epimerase